MNDDIARRLDVQDVVTRMFVSTDRRDWAALQLCFTDPFTLDMTSMAGGAPMTLTPQEVSQAWADGFRLLDHVHHQIGNMQIELSGAGANACPGAPVQARCRCTG